MFLLKKPSPAQVRRFITCHSDLPFSYSEVGATAEQLPAGYRVDHNRQKLGHGAEIFDRAVAVLNQWNQFDLGWVKIVPDELPIEVGIVVGVLARHFGFWSLSACRIAYLVDEGGPIRKIGFAYGTLIDHVERGEERFIIEYHSADGSVWYDILAFSQPGKLIIKLSLPLARMVQKRFARDSKRRMLDCAAPGKR